LRGTQSHFAPVHTHLLNGSFHWRQFEGLTMD
jgi:hypothetical protein